MSRDHDANNEHPDRFESGPAIGTELIAWLDAHAAGRLIQLPVEIHGGPLGIERAYLRSEQAKIPIELDTGALSLDLPMRLAGECTYPCRVWLEGTWGALVPGSMPNSRPTFAVQGYIGPAGDAETSVRFPK